MREFERIAAIGARLGGRFDGVVLGIGDDGAILGSDARPQVVSTDAAVAGVHFDWHFGDTRALGERAAVTALSDLAAMGATPRAMLLSLQLPANFDDVRLLTFVDGVADAARTYAAPVVGGNLARGKDFAATTTVLGALDGAPLTRQGAREGDGVFVTGPLGGAALGVRLLLDGLRERGPAEAVQCWLRPRARIERGRALGGACSAAIDISDGLVQDLGHICAASGVGAVIRGADLPRPDWLDGACDALGLDPIALCATGGEDFELLYTASSDDPRLGVRIGEIVRGPGITVLDADGAPTELGEHTGFQHF